MKGLLSKFEYIVIGVFALIFIMWAASKCSAYKEQARIEAGADNPVVESQKADPPTTPSTPAPPPDTTGAKLTVASNQPATSPQATPIQEPQGSRLYVTIDKLKLRKSPGLNGELIGELNLFDEVFYQNEVTDSLYQLNLGKELANEPYVKIKTKRGTVGWVYGAGVHYIKKKRSGVLE